MFRVHVSSWRSGKRRVRTVALIDEAPAIDPYAAADARAVLQQVLTGLPAPQRAVLVLSYLDDAPDDEIALVIGRTRSTVRTLRRRGLAALRERLSGSEGDELTPVEVHRA
jgi:RNA polymerase sigma factor (sigma-70 family)